MVQLLAVGSLIQSQPESHGINHTPLPVLTSTRVFWYGQSSSGMFTQSTRGPFSVGCDNVTARGACARRLGIQVGLLSSDIGELVSGTREISCTEKA